MEEEQDVLERIEEEEEEESMESSEENGDGDDGDEEDEDLVQVAAGEQYSDGSSAAARLQLENYAVELQAWGVCVDEATDAMEYIESHPCAMPEEYMQRLEVLKCLAAEAAVVAPPDAVVPEASAEPAAVAPPDAVVPEASSEPAAVEPTVAAGLQDLACAICLQDEGGRRLPITCCTTVQSSKFVHLACMQEHIQATPTQRLRCVLCRSVTPFTEEVMIELRAYAASVAPVPNASASFPPSLAGSGDPWSASPTLASYRDSRLVRAPLIEMQTSDPEVNSLRDTLFSGANRGCPWRILMITHSSPQPAAIEEARPVITAVHAEIAGLFTGDPLLLSSSGSLAHSFVFVKLMRPQRMLSFHPLADGSTVLEHHIRNRMQGAALFQLVSEMVRDSRALIGNIELRQAGNGQPTALSWEATLTELGELGRPNLRAITANAKHAQRYGSPTPLQLSLLLYKEDLAAHYRDLQVASTLTVPLTDIHTKYPRDFATALPELDVWEWNPVTRCIQHSTLEAYEQGKYMDKSLILLNNSGAGKTQLGRSLAKKFAIRKQKSVIAQSKSIDPFGCATRSGVMDEVGAFLFNDIAFRTLMKDQLTEEDVKQMFDVRETCTLPARYHAAAFPAHHARIFCWNAGLTPQGEVDPGQVFLDNGLNALWHLANQDELAIRALSDHASAICRRVVMCAPTMTQIGLQVGVIQDEAARSYAAELAIEAEYEQSLR